MIRLEDIKSGALIQGIEPEEVVRIVTSEPIGADALTVYYKKSDGSLLERLIYRSDELKLSLAKAGRPWSFDALGADFKLAVEACRINLAYLFERLEEELKRIGVSRSNKRDLYRLRLFYKTCPQIMGSLNAQLQNDVDQIIRLISETCNNNHYFRHCCAQRKYEHGLHQSKMRQV